MKKSTDSTGKDSDTNTLYTNTITKSETNKTIPEYLKAHSSNMGKNVTDFHINVSRSGYL